MDWAWMCHEPLAGFSRRHIFSSPFFMFLTFLKTRLTLHPLVPEPSQRRTLADRWSRRFLMWVRQIPRLWRLSFCSGFPWCECWGWGCPCCWLWLKEASKQDPPMLRSSSRPAVCWAGCTYSAAPRSSRPALVCVWPAAPGDLWSAALWHKAPHPSSCPLAPAPPPGPSGNPGSSFWTHRRDLCAHSRQCVCSALISLNRSPYCHLETKESQSLLLWFKSILQLHDEIWH